MKVLIGMEESATIRQEFEKTGHDAWSCDLLPSRVPGQHLQCDIWDVLDKGWDLMILHPDCTCLSVSGNRHYARGRAGWFKRYKALKWTYGLWCHSLMTCPKVCLEQPVSVLASHPGMPKAHYIQPWEFGHGETKNTALFLHGLPPLQPTNIVSGRENRVWKMGPSPTRKRDRSKTYQGVASAMAEQWGCISTNNIIYRSN